MFAPVPDDDDLRKPGVGVIGLLDHQETPAVRGHVCNVPLLESTVRPP